MKNTSQTFLKLLIAVVLLSFCKYNFANNKSLSSLQFESSGQIEDTVKSSKNIVDQDAYIEDTILAHSEKMPEFPGGRDSMFHFISNNLKYPKEAFQKGITGKVYVQFIVTSEGKCKSIKVLKGIGGGCDEEVIRIVKLFPNWIPGQQQGKLVNVFYTIPILFNIEEQPQYFVEEMPRFPGGEDSLMNYINNNLIFPEEAKKKNRAAIVIVKFVITKEGKVANPQIIKGVEQKMNEEALRLVRTFPDWVPGKQKGYKVPVYIKLPIIFQSKKKNIKQKFNLGNDFGISESPASTMNSDSLDKFISRNLKYPKDAQEKGISGQVMISFKVTKKGKIDKPKVIGSVYPSIDGEALRLIQLIPYWTPATHKKKSINSFCILFLSFHTGNNQNIDSSMNNVPIQTKFSMGKNLNSVMYGDEPLAYVEQMPQFPDGSDAMMKYLSANINYPSLALKMGITGRVILQFIVDKQGKIYNIKVLRGIGGGCDEEAIRVVRSMPSWIPGKQNGMVVPVFFTLPIVFSLK